MFASVEDVQQHFKNARYIANRRISTVVYLAERMRRPVLVEGPAGVGKTELAKTLAEVTNRLTFCVISCPFLIWPTMPTCMSYTTSAVFFGEMISSSD